MSTPRTYAQPVVVVDTFTSVPFRGNPAAVCVVPHFPEGHALQQIAAEMNLPETAFLVKRAPLVYNIRWFSPSHEVDLCGHATLAAAHALREQGEAGAGDIITFHSPGGELRARCGLAHIELDFPLLPGSHVPVTPALKRCLGVPIRAAEHNGTNLLVEVETMELLQRCQPNLKAIAALEAESLIVTTATGCGDFDFASRCFSPRVGIPEDPVTGSAHCMLAPYWAAVLEKSQFRAFQASQRTGILDVRIEEDRVFIGGRAVTTLRGVIELEDVYALDHAA